jgi:hypothetical protein
MKFHIWCRGDRTVGDYGSSVEVDWPELSEDPNDQERTEYIISVKENLKESFVKIFDDKNTLVMTDKEFEEYTKDPMDY